MADIFISYTHRDNAKLSDEQYGWVDRFHEALEIRLATLWGHQADIWRDFKTQGNDVLTPTIERGVVEASILVTVLSPGYVHSEWCNKELQLFCAAAKKGRGLQVGTRSRIIKVVKTPVELNSTRSDLVDVIGYPFYQLDERGAPLEFDARAGDKSRQQFLAKVNEVAYDVCSMLETLTGKRSGRQIVAPLSGLMVYLAESTSDIGAASDLLRRELEQMGHTVLPREPLGHGADYVQRSMENLQQATLSVHPIGTSYGIVPEGLRESILELQYKAAGQERARRADFVRVPWMLPGTAAKDERIAAFVDELQNDPQLLITSLDNVKTAVGELLTRGQRKQDGRSQSVSESRSDPGRVTSVYLVADRCDLAPARAWEDALFAAGYEVVHPLREGSETEVRIDHEENLTVCDAILIYHGATTEFWLRTKLRDLQKAFGYGRSAPFLAAAVLLAPPDRPDKTLFRSNDVITLNATNGFSPAALAPFLDRLARAGSEAS